jgi:hypothetical protein
MGADFGPLFNDDDTDFRRNLFDPDRSRKPCRTRAHDNDVEFHHLAAGQVVNHVCSTYRSTGTRPMMLLKDNMLF